MRQIYRSGCAALGALAIGGCLLACSSPSLVADNFGTAKKQLQERQTQNPEQSETRNPVNGMGAATAAEVTENYHRNQKTTAQQARQERARDSGISAVE